MSHKHTIIAAAAYYVAVFIAASYHISSVAIVAAAPVLYFVLACVSAFASYIVVTIAAFAAKAGYFFFGLEKPADAIEHMNREAIIYIVFMVVLVGTPIYMFM